MNNVFTLQKTFESKVFKIPDYQRGYAWEEQHLLDLWEDIEFLASGKKHYTGNLVLQRLSGVSVQAADGSRHEVFDVVDGQQRLTTLVILLECLRPWFRKDRPRIEDGLLTSYVRFLDQNDQRAYRLSLNGDCQDFFARNIVGEANSPEGIKAASHQRLSAAKAFFQNRIEEKSKALGSGFAVWRDDFLERISQRLELGHYLVDDSSEVGIIFEVMNNRGKPLSELEKVKNYLLYLSSKLAVQNHGLAGEVNKAWAEIFTRLMAAGLGSSDYEDRLLRAHWLMAYDPNRRNWQGSKSIKNLFHLRIDPAHHKKLLADLTEYVNSLRDACIAFCDAFNPTRNDTFGSFEESSRLQMRFWMEKLARSGVRSPFLPLLMAARNRLSGDLAGCLQILKTLELYEFRVFRWEGKRANAGENRLLRLGYEFFHGSTNVELLCTEIRSRALSYLSNKDFLDGFTPGPDNSFYHWPGIRYLLYEYELELTRGRTVRIRWDDLQGKDPQRTIEHVLPQSPSNAYWQERFKEEDILKYTNAIGNLSLTLDNSSYSNKAFPDKCGDAMTKTACYAGSGLYIERDIAANYTDWTPATIEARGNRIRDWAVSRWHIDDSAVGGITLTEAVEESEEQE